jgi:hypothetical protein
MTPGCRCTLAREVLEQEFLASVGQLQPNPDYSRLLAQLLRDALACKTEEIRNRRLAVDRQLEECQSKVATLRELFLYQRTISMTLFDDETERLENTMRELRRERCDLDERSHRGTQRVSFNSQNACSVARRRRGRQRRLISGSGSKGCISRPD